MAWDTGRGLTGAQVHDVVFVEGDPADAAGDQAAGGRQDAHQPRGLRAARRAGATGGSSAMRGGGTHTRLVRKMKVKPSFLGQDAFSFHTVGMGRARMSRSVTMFWGL